MMTYEYDSELEYYLWCFDATKEERKCARMWVTDGHPLCDNDYGFEDMHFLEAIWNYPYYGKKLDCTESFYDPRTYSYIKSKNPTPYEWRKVRNWIREGNDFMVGDEDEGGKVNYFDYIRNKEFYDSLMFYSYHYEDLQEYAAEFIHKKHLVLEFLKYAKKRKIKQGKLNDNPFSDELPF